ncbi:MAG: hypothetical protein HAW66_01045 [Shewanella sp.]|nr:hypothetical protein [Shewanella sp.]
MNGLKHYSKLTGLIALLLLTSCASHDKPTCKPLSDLDYNKDPAALFAGLDTCLTDEEFTSAAEMYFAGMNNGHYDSKRVGDSSVFNSVGKMKDSMLAIHPKERLDALAEEVHKMTINNGDICSKLKAIGKPTYKPKYISDLKKYGYSDVEHLNELIKGFDSDGVWDKTLNSVTGCK